MTWRYQQSTGKWFEEHKYIATGYSGHEEGKNNPAFEQKRGVGPLPRGRYTIGPKYDTETHGPCVMALTPHPETETYGRSGFLIHGDSIKKPGTASLGCIILPRIVREMVAASPDKALEVFA